MASTYLGNHPSHKYQVVERIDTHKQLTWGDSGKLFACFSSDAESAQAAAGNAILVNLPKLSIEMAGWHAKFVLATGISDSGVVNQNDVGFKILSFGQPEAGNKDVEGIDFEKMSWLEMRNSSSGGNTLVQDGDGAAFSATTPDERGSMIQVYSNGSRWFVYGIGAHDDSTQVIGS